VVKLLLGSKKVRGCKNGTVFIYHHTKYGGDRGSRAGCRRKSVMLFLSVRLSHFGITKFVITETLWTSEIFKTIMVPLRRGRFLVVHLYSNFSMDPLGFFLGANLYQKLLFSAIYPQPKFCKNRLRGIPLFGKFIPKITNFGDFGGCKPTF